MSHSSLLRIFGFSAISNYDSYLPSILGTNALIWDFFQNVWKGRFLRSKDVRGWILRLQPRNFLPSSESSASNLWKVRQTSVWQKVPKLLFFVFFIVSQRLTLVSNAKRKENISELWNHLSYRGMTYFFEVGSQTFRAT